MILEFEQLKNYRKTVAMVDGAFDPLHRGHIEYFRAAAGQLDVPLLCNVASDRYVRTKHPPLLPEDHRAAVVDAIRGWRYEPASKGGIKVNFLVNYGWEWDLNNLKTANSKQTGIINDLKSRDVSKIDLIIRWGGWSRLSGFLPVQSIYADIFIVDELWPDFKPAHFTKALEWYSKQDITLGG